jgi:hypothetical protein
MTFDGSVAEHLRPLIERPPGINLKDLSPLALLDRTDTKFVVSAEQMQDILAAAIDHYCVLQVNGVRPGRYVTTYFDTPDFAMYFAHHNGERYRYKLRCRSYLDSQMVFVEVKMKNNKDRMVKFRRRANEHLQSLAGFDSSWLPPHFPYAFDDVHAVVWNRFLRITLASHEYKERITVDMDVEFGCGSEAVTYTGMCIVEIKQAKFSLTRSPLARELHRLHLQPRSVSKFCVAAAHFYPGFKRNHFKPLLLYLGRQFPLRGLCERPA